MCLTIKRQARLNAAQRNVPPWSKKSKTEQLVESLSWCRKKNELKQNKEILEETRASMTSATLFSLRPSKKSEHVLDAGKLEQTNSCVAKSSFWAVLFPYVCVIFASHWSMRTSGASFLLSTLICICRLYAFASLFYLFFHKKFTNFAIHFGERFGWLCISVTAVCSLASSDLFNKIIFSFYL